VSAVPSTVLATRSMSSTFDVGRTVQGWNLNFSGQKGHSVEEFLQRINERNNLACLPEQDLLNAITETLTGVALQWFRRKKHEFATWNQFCEAARAQFGVHRRYQSRIIREAENRTQGSSEPAYEYIFKLLTILGRLAEPWPKKRQVQLLYDNLRPDIRKNVPLHKVVDVESLIRLAEEAEFQVMDEMSFREPPPPEKCLFVDTAYSAPKPMGNAKVIVAAVNPPKSEEKAGRSDDPQISELLEEVRRMKKTSAELEKDTSEEEKLVERVKRKEPIPPDGDEGGRKNRGRSPINRKPRVQKTENAGESPGPLGKYTGYGCGCPGWIRSACPACSVKGKGAQ